MNFFLSITPPPAILSRTPANDVSGGGLIVFLNLILQLIFMLGGLYALWQCISAGFTLIGSGGDAKALGSARDKFIWSLVGLILMASATVIAGVAGLIVTGEWNWILNPSIIVPEPSTMIPSPT